MLFIQYLGQNGFVVTDGRMKVSFDLYLSNYVFEQSGEGKRKYEAPCKIEELLDIDYYFISHDHMDHMDIPTIKTISKLSGGVKFICPAPAVRRMEEIGIASDRIISAKASCEFKIDNIFVMPIPEKHEDYLIINGNHSFLGYVLRWDEYTFFHSGDAMADNDLVSYLMPFRGMDIMFLPINGHDRNRYKKGIMGNMTYREALDLAAELEADLVVPMHYDLFNENTENPSFFVDYLYREYPYLKFKMFMPGETIIFSRETR